MARLTLVFFGSFQATLAGQPLRHLHSTRLQALLAYLVLEANRPHTRDELATRFWPDEPESVAKQNLRQALYQLRQALDEPIHPTAAFNAEKSADSATIPQFERGREPLGYGGEAPYLLLTRTTAQFNPASDYTLDVVNFQQQLQQQQLTTALTLYQGDLLSGLANPSPLFEEWLVVQRERYHIQALALLDQVTQQALQQADYGAAQRYARQQLALEPWRETAHRQLITALAQSGDRTAALAHYESCRRLLAAELGAPPDAETEALVGQIRAAGNDKALGWPRAKATAVVAITPASPHLVTPPPHHSITDWADAPDIAALHGREAEQAELTRWLVQDRCRVVTVLGMGGMGKTALTTYLAHQLSTHFAVVIWRSLLNAPPLTELLQGWLRVLSGLQAAKAPESLDEQLALLFDHLRQQRCLLILDNAESIMQSGERAGYYRADYEAYGQLFKRLGESQHQSSLLITSREQPHEVTRLLRETPLVRSLSLHGLPTAAAQAILRAQGMVSSTTAAEQLIQRYSGNPLALMLIAETIQELFNGDVAAFLQEEAPIFDDIRDVLDQQYARLAPLERDLLLTLAIQRQPMGETALWQAFAHTSAKRQVLEAVRSLQRRSLLESYTLTAEGAAFGLQNVVIEYLTDRLITQVYHEVLQETPGLLHSHPLLRVHAQEYIRQSQARILLQPIGEWLLGTLGRPGLATRVQRLLATARREQPLRPGFLAGNLLNLLLQLGIDLRGYDFSNLCVWQAYLQGASLRGVNFSGADLAQSTFTDTFAAIYTLAYSPDGTLLAAGTANGGIRFWQTATGAPWAARQDPAGTVYSIAFSPDGRLLASAGGDEQVRLWEVATTLNADGAPQPLPTSLTGPTNLIWSVAFSPDGAWLAAGDFDGNVSVWRVATRQLVHRWPGHTAWVRKVLFTPDSHQVISASRDGYVMVWNVVTGELQQRWRAHEAWVISATVSADGRLLATGSSDHTARLWELADGRLRMTLTGHSEWVSGVAFHPQTNLLATVARDLQLRFWDIENGETRHLLQGHTDFPHTLAFAPDGKSLASGGDDQTVRLWHTHTGHALQTLQGYTFWMRAIAFGPAHPLPHVAPSLAGAGEGPTFAYAGIDRTIYLQRLRADPVHSPIALDGPSHQLRGHKLLIIALAFSQDGRYLVSGSADQTVCVWAALDGQRTTDNTPTMTVSSQPLQTLHGHTRIVSAVAFSPDGDLVASSGEDRTVRLWTWQNGQVHFVLHGHNGGVNSVVFHPEGRLLASGSGDRTIRLWDVHNGECLSILSRERSGGELGLVRSVAFSPTGAHLVSAGDDCLVRLWDWANGQQVYAFAGHTKYITAVAFSPDGQCLASAGADQTVRLWDLATGQQRGCLSGHQSVIYGLAFSPDGQLLATNSIDETVRFWDVASGACRQCLRMTGPYAGMNISGVTGIGEAQKASLQALGAIDVAAVRR